jgi:uncharacterized protein YfaT (DUF1175 family)
MLANKWRILLCLTFWLIGSWLLYHIGIGAFTPADLFALVDQTFKEDIWPRINENPTAVGLYRGLVWLGTCLLMGQLLS